MEKLDGLYCSECGVRLIDGHKKGERCHPLSCDGGKAEERWAITLGTFYGTIDNSRRKLGVLVDGEA